MSESGVAIERVLEFLRGLEDCEERTSHGTPAFFVRRQFAHVWPDGHHQDLRAQIWLAAPLGAQEVLVERGEPFFRPPYVGARGWIGVHLDACDADWEQLVLDAHDLAG